MKRFAFVFLLVAGLWAVNSFAVPQDEIEAKYDLRYEMKVSKNTGFIHKDLWCSVLLNINIEYFEIVDYICADSSECTIVIKYVEKNENLDSQFLEVVVKDIDNESSSVEITSYGQIFNKYAVSIHQRVSRV